MLKRLVQYVLWLLLAVSVGFPVAAQQLSPDWARRMNDGKAWSADVQIGGSPSVPDREILPQRMLTTLGSPPGSRRRTESRAGQASPTQVALFDLASRLLNFATADSVERI
jgi:hypothetical protein